MRERESDEETEKSQRGKWGKMKKKKKNNFAHQIVLVSSAYIFRKE